MRPPDNQAVSELNEEIERPVAFRTIELYAHRAARGE
jgi:hypothetical protein